ncbi:MAG: sigma-70 family RNA polymerase sigma factor [Oscillospiraceae bacterium]|nr:sigma-70 family RNA polymerase sigma factor [Oscillospiraceae bacterium]
MTAEQYGGLCQSIARNILKNEQDAEECLNDALLQTWNSIPPAKPKNFCAYLLRIVQNLAIDRFRAKAREKRGGTQPAAALDELAEFLPSSENVQSEVEQRDLLAAITRFLEGLPQKQRGLFIRRYWGCASYSELAEAYHMQKHNVEVSLSRIRQNLRDHLRKEGVL